MTQHRSLSVIAAEIEREIKSNAWPARSSFYALPYVKAMRELDNLSQSFGHDSARSVVLYFLSNASTWRGDVARRVKVELREMLNEH